MIEQMYTANMNEPQRAQFYARYQAVRKDEIVGVLLALLLGTFGVHHFYLGRKGLGILYLCFFWTGIPSIVSFVECFFMPGRVREFNMMQAAMIAAAVQGGYAATNVYAQPPALAHAVSICNACGGPVAGPASFCPSCGVAVTA